MNASEKKTPRVLEDIKQAAAIEQQQSDDALENESKADCFKRIAQNRMGNTLNELRKLGNLSNRSIYEYTDDQIDKMERAIYARLDETFKKLRHVKRSEDGFSF